MNKHIGEYIKDSRGIKKGFLLAFKDSENRIRIGWSLYAKNKEDKPFDKYVSKAMAYLRANYFERLAYPSSLKSKINKFYNRSCRYFKDTKDYSLTF